MHLTYSPLTSALIRECETFWCGRAACTAVEVRHALTRAAALLEARAARGVIIREPGGRACCYGLTAFVDEHFAEAYLRAPHPLVGKRLLLDEPDAILVDEAVIGARNAGDGLQMVVLGQDWNNRVLDASALEAMMLAMIAGFFEIHRGFRLARILNEAIGEPIVTDIASSRAFASYHHMECRTLEGTSLPSLLAIADRQYAVASRGLLLPMFLYEPPQFGFTRAQRDLLRAALPGLTDRQVAEFLNIPLTSVKARWTRIHERIAERRPALFQERTSKRSAVRGEQTRHVILEHVRRNPSELTPFAPARPPTGAAKG